MTLPDLHTAPLFTELNISSRDFSDNNTLRKLDIIASTFVLFTFKSFSFSRREQIIMIIALPIIENDNSEF